MAQIAAAGASEPAAVAAALTDWANAQGGQDNITVALARLDGQNAGAHADPAQPRESDG
jgi:serine/threonine protein phosphatase PrpC